MDNAAKRGRGRPAGSGLNDGPVLAKIADMMIAVPTLKPTTAAKRVLDAPDDATIRRLQAKWKKAGQRYLDQALARRDAKISRQTESGPGLRVARHIALAQLAGERMSGGAMLLAGMDHPALRAIRAAQENPTVRLMQEIYNRPEMRLMRELYDSPQMRLAREMSKMRRLAGGL